MTPGVQLLAVRRHGGNGGSYQGALEELEGSWVEDQGFHVEFEKLVGHSGEKGGWQLVMQVRSREMPGLQWNIFIHLPATG